MDTPSKQLHGEEKTAIIRHESPDKQETEQQQEDAVSVASVARTQTARSQDKTPEQRSRTQSPAMSALGAPEDLEPFDWDSFDDRVAKALQDADDREDEILKEAEDLSKYFRTWASAASVHDDERMMKRLRTRQRFVNLSEEKLSQKQQHYEEVVRAFESALALLRSG